MGILFGELERWAKIILCRALDGACEFYALSLTGLFCFEQSLTTTLVPGMASPHLLWFSNNAE